MKTKSVVRSSRSCLLALAICFFVPHLVYAEIVELSITGYWSEKDFKVTLKPDPTFSLTDPKFDGKVFGVAPLAGEVTVKLVVNTEGSVFFPKGAQNVSRGTSHTLEHDFYGYKDVTLAGGTFSFGTAIWSTDGIVARLEGPDGSQAALWTDVDITKEDPTRVSFRMFGKAEGLQADLFVGGRSASKIGGGFLLWEYYQGEEIRSKKFISRRKLSSQ